MSTEDQIEPGHRRFFVERNIPIAVLVVVAAQFVGSMWWAATFSSSMSEKMNSVSASISELKAEKYTKDDARRDRELFMAIIDAQRQADRDFDRRLGSIETTHQNLLKGR